MIILTQTQPPQPAQPEPSTSWIEQVQGIDALLGITVLIAGLIVTTMYKIWEMKRDTEDSGKCIEEMGMTINTSLKDIGADVNLIKQSDAVQEDNLQRILKELEQQERDLKSIETSINFLRTNDKYAEEEIKSLREKMQANKIKIGSIMAVLKAAHHRNPGIISDRPDIFDRDSDLDYL